MVTNVDNVAVRESVVKAVQTLGYDYPPPVKRPSTGNSSAVAELLSPVFGRVFRSYYLAIYSPSKLLVGVSHADELEARNIRRSHMTVTLQSHAC